MQNSREDKNNVVGIINLPNIPKQVSFKDLADTEKGLLITEAESHALLSALSGLSRDWDGARLSKKQFQKQMKELNINVKWPKNVRSIHIEFNENGQLILYAIYKGKRHSKELGSGTSGTVKLAQRIGGDNKWHAYKVRAVSGYMDAITDELNKLKELKLSEGMVAAARISTRPGVYNAGFILDYAGGIPLDHLIAKQPQLSAIQWLDIALQALEKTHQFHQADYVHRDIKPGNMLIDLVNGTLSIVDAGSACRIKKPCDATGSTPLYQAPEIAALSKENYIAATVELDIYSLGLTLQHLLGITHSPYGKKGGSIVPNTPFKNDPELVRLLKQMTAPEPGHRPSLPDVIKKLQVFRAELLPVYPKTTGIVQVNDYMAAKDKKAFIAALRSVDTVFLAESHQEKNAFYYSKIRRELEAAGVAVRSEVLVSKNPQALVEKAHELDAESVGGPGAVVSRVCYFCPHGRGESLTGAHTIEVTSKNRNYRKEIEVSEVPLTEDQLKKITEMLEEQLKKISSKDLSKELIAGRKMKLDAAVLYFKEPSNVGKITFSNVYNKLNTLEKELLAAEKKPRFSIFIRKSQAVKAVSKLKNDFKANENQAPSIPKMKR